ncbi:MAG: N-acyl-D-amino-acid deacylase [Paraglaciecola sp.]|jgi:N-acyl-D-amino-acid deacylase
MKNKFGLKKQQLIHSYKQLARYVFFPLILVGCTDNSVISDPEPRLGQTQLVENAMIVDGTGAPAYLGDVRFSKEGILQIGDLNKTPGDTVIDGTGLMLTPGFIDTHSHHDYGLMQHPDATAAISQGITTIAIGNDGYVREISGDLKKKLANNPTAINLATFTGHGWIRSQVMGEDFKRQATPEEIVKMKALLTEDMNNGSLGLSTGLEYDPGIYSSTEEVIALAKTASKLGGIYISHMRSEDRDFDAAVEELIKIGREANIPVQISHIKLAAVNLWGQADRVIQRLDAARAEGINVSADIYPYTYWQATLTVLLPERDFNDLEAARFALENLAHADDLTLTSYAPDPSLIGKNVAEIAVIRKQSNEETYLQLIRDAYGKLSDEQLDNSDGIREMVIGVSMSENDISEFMAWPHSNICSDGSNQGHPRGFGAFPRAIRKYVKEQKILTIEQMIHKMTSLSAQHINLKGVGEIKPDFAADFVLFNLKTITDRATIKSSDLLSEGIVGVWVNGERVFKDNKVTENRPGTFKTASNVSN